MSERELRQWLADCQGRFVDLERDGVHSGVLRRHIELALSEPPDVVVLLRWLTGWRDTYTDKLTGDLYAPPDMAWATIEATINEIEKTVRLTDDGRWEWVD